MREPDISNICESSSSTLVDFSISNKEIKVRIFSILLEFDFGYIYIYFMSCFGQILFNPHAKKVYHIKHGSLHK